MSCLHRLSQKLGCSKCYNLFVLHLVSGVRAVRFAHSAYVKQKFFEVALTEQEYCFLCAPDERLVVDRTPALFAMVGLGPITDRYLLIASTDHVRSFADLHQSNEDLAGQVATLRRKLQGDGPALLMTEHGRVPACVDGEDGHDAHCFHAHFLLFEASQDIHELCASYFLNSESFSSLSDALEYAGTCENYHLLSPDGHDYRVFSGALNVPRQFFRQMVAHAEGLGELADWRENPCYDKALANAELERQRLGVIS